MISVLFVIIGLSLLVLVHEWGHFLAARYFGLLVEEFGIGFPPRIFKKKIGETLYSVNAIPLGGFVKIYGENAASEKGLASPQRSFVHQSAWRRAVIVCAGVAMNFLFGWLLVSAIFLVGSPSVIFVESIVAGSPASSAGLEKGDIILGFENAAEFINYINSNKGGEIPLRIKRGGEELNLVVTPRLDPPPGEGALGVALRDAGLPRHGLLASIGKGLLSSLAITTAVFAGLYQAVFSPENLIGPVGIFGAAIDTGQLGFIYLFQFLALISLNLAVLNILPIPVLDGGRLFFILIEKIRGQKFSPQTENRANAIGLAFLLTLIVLITVKDIAGLL